MSLLATSTTGALHCAEVIGGAGAIPNDVGHAASRSLLSEIQRGGCVDRHHQWLVLLLMVLGSEDVGRCRMGELTVKSYASLFVRFFEAALIYCEGCSSCGTSSNSLGRRSRLFQRRIRIRSLCSRVLARAISTRIRLFRKAHLCIAIVYIPVSHSAISDIYP